MDEATAFLDHVMPRLRDEVVALENGDARPRKGPWSHHDPVTLVGAEVIHRHGDPYDITSRQALNRRRQHGAM